MVIEMKGGSSFFFSRSNFFFSTSRGEPQIDNGSIFFRAGYLSVKMIILQAVFHPRLHIKKSST